MLNPPRSAESINEPFDGSLGHTHQRAVDETGIYNRSCQNSHCIVK